MKHYSLHFRKWRAMATVCIVAGLSSGCNSFERFYSEVHADQFDNAFSKTELACFEGYEVGEARCGTITPFVGISDKTSRNNYISVKMFEIDRSYHQFITLLNASDAGIVSFANFAQLGLTTAATAIPVVQTTKVLATAATAVGGSKAIYNQDLLRTQTLQALENQMDADRTKIKNIIVERMNNCDAKEYPLGFVLSDLQSYASAGTPDSALVSLNSSASKAKESATSSSSTASTEVVVQKIKDDDVKKIKGGSVTIKFQPSSPCPLNDKKDRKS